MTATTNKGVYIVGKPNPNANAQGKIETKRISDAVKRTSEYKKK